MTPFAPEPCVLAGGPKSADTCLLRAKIVKITSIPAPMFTKFDAPISPRASIREKSPVRNNAVMDDGLADPRRHIDAILRQIEIDRRGY